MAAHLTEKESKDLDKIISFLANSQNFYDAEAIRDELFPSEEVSYVDGLIDTLIAQSNDVVFRSKNNLRKLVRADTSAKSFLAKGGFTGMYIEQVKNLKMDQERKKKQDQILDLTIDDLVDKIIDQPKLKNRLARAEIIASVSALAALVSAIAAIVALKGC